jgi:hypothetical protein
VPLANQLQDSLIRPEDNTVILQSPEETEKFKKQLTTPRSPNLSVKKRGELSQIKKNLKSTEQMELEKECK